MLQCDVMQAVSKDVQQASFWFCTILIEAEFQANAIHMDRGYHCKIALLFWRQQCANVSVVVQTDDDAATAHTLAGTHIATTASCRLAWSISGLLFPLCQISVHHE